MYFTEHTMADFSVPLYGIIHLQLLTYPYNYTESMMLGRLGKMSAVLAS